MAQPTSVTATVTKGGRIRIPMEVLRHLQLKEGQQIIFFLKEESDAALLAPLSEAVSVPKF